MVPCASYDSGYGSPFTEDPQVAFYLRALDWTEFARTSGHGHVAFHPEDGPLWPIVGHANITLADDGVEARGIVAAPARRLLHLSDLHFETADEADIAYSQLAADLRQQGVEQLDALVVSGDLVNRATVGEYAAAGLFLEKLKSGFGLTAHAVVLVPGNHDVSWAYASSAYRLMKRGTLHGELAAGTYIEHGPEVVEVRDDEAYRLRFAPFAELYEKIRGAPAALEFSLRWPSRRSMNTPRRAARGCHCCGCSPVAPRGSSRSRRLACGFRTSGQRSTGSCRAT
jgi:hypothetical protein